MKLYHAPGACSLAVHIALREAGIGFDLVKVDLVEHTLEDGRSYYDIAPRGYVPMLEFDDGSRHTEAAARVSPSSTATSPRASTWPANSAWPMPMRSRS